VKRGEKKKEKQEFGLKKTSDDGIGKEERNRFERKI